MADATPFTSDQDWGRPVAPVVFSDSPEAIRAGIAAELAEDPNSPNAQHYAAQHPVPIPAFWIEPDPAAGSHLYHD